MEINVMGLGHTTGAQKTNGSLSNGMSGFGSVLAGVVTATQSNTGQPPSLISDSKLNALTQDNVQGLLQFLNTTTIFDLENGMELLDKIAFQNDVELLTVIAEELELSPEQLLASLKELLEQQILEGNDKLKELDDSNPNAMFAAMISLLQMNDKHLKATLKIDNQGIGALKAIKLYELLSSQKDSFQAQLKLTDFLKGIGDKLEGLLNKDNRNEMLKKTFSTVVQELKGKNINMAQSNTQTENTPKSADGLAKLNIRTDSTGQGFLQFEQMSKPEQLVLANPNGRPVSTEQLIQQFQSILARGKFVHEGGTQRLLIQLNPEHLGSLKIELIQKDSMMIARILTSTATAKEMMDSQLHGLRQAFNAQNIQVERVEISQANPEQERSFQREQQENQQGQQEQRNNEGTNKDKPDFSDSFEEAILNFEA